MNENTIYPVGWVDPKAVILAEIEALEQRDKAGRFVRESLLLTAPFIAGLAAAEMTAAGVPTTKEQLLLANTGFQKAVELNKYIGALRAKLAVL